MSGLQIHTFGLIPYLSYAYKINIFPSRVQWCNFGDLNLISVPKQFCNSSMGLYDLYNVDVGFFFSITSFLIRGTKMVYAMSTDNVGND